MKSHKTLTALLLFAAMRSATFADPVSFLPSKDNTLYEDPAGQLSNGQGIYLYAGKAIAGLLRRGLIAFDLSAIPTNATVTAASLSMYLSRLGPVPSADISVSKVLRDWGEGASNAGVPGGGGAPAEPGDATWIHTFYNTSFWTTPCGDFSPTLSATTTVSTWNTTYLWSSPGLLVDVQSWVSNPASNFGWVILGDEIVETSAARFGSRENTSNAPRLNVTFQVLSGTPTPSPTPVTTPTPTPTPLPTVKISGNVAYCPGSPVPVKNVTLNLTGSTTASTLSNGCGNYQFSSLASGGTYTVTPTKGDLPPGLGTTGINTADALLVQKHFLSGGTLLTGCALAAARTNANNLGDPNTSDALFIQQFFLFSPNPLPTSNRAGQWRFSPANRTYPGVNVNQTGQNYDAFALGDVNGDLAIPESAATLPTTPMRVSVPVAVAKVALPNVDPSLSDFVAEVSTSNIAGGDKLVAFQGDFTFDERVVTFQSPPVARAGLTANGNWALAANVLGTGTIKTLRVSCFALDANSVLSGEGPLFELRMTRVSSKPGASTQLIWAAEPNNFIFLDDNLQWRVPASTPPGSVTARPAKGRR